MLFPWRPDKLALAGRLELGRYWISTPDAADDANDLGSEDRDEDEDEDEEKKMERGEECGT
jgi:hypothetical protein